MPELPEVETVARTLLPHVQGCVFESAKLLRSSAMHPASMPLEALNRMRVQNLRRRGKVLVFDLTPTPDRSTDMAVPTSMVIHLRMTGRVFTQEANSGQGAHTRCIWKLHKPDFSPFLLFFDDIRTFGKVFVATEQLLANWDFWKNLGPEPLEIGLAEFASRLNGKRALKSCLLDQTVIAGIGNIYADEALFAAGLDPRRPASSLARQEHGRLLSAIKAILARAIEKKGSSIRDYRDADGNAGSFQKTFSVYGKGGKMCQRCGEVLQKEQIGGRATVFCPHCQK